MSCPLTASESSGLFWDEAVEHTAFSLHHPALSGGLPGSSVLLVLTFRPTWINETSCGGTPEFHSSNPHSSHLAHAMYRQKGCRGCETFLAQFLSGFVRQGEATTGKRSVFSVQTESKLSCLQTLLNSAPIFEFIIKRGRGCGKMSVTPLC